MVTLETNRNRDALYNFQLQGAFGDCAEANS
jgi:hypothetical protein